MSMTLEKFVHYGYDRDTYRDCTELIHWTNRRHMRIINTWFLAVNLLYMIFSTQNLFGVNETNTAFYAAFVGIGAVFEAMLFFCRDFLRKFTMPFVYLIFLMLAVYGIMTSLSQPYMAATMFQVLMVLAGLSFITAMDVGAGMLLIFGMAFLWSSFMYKPMVIVYQDLYNTILFWSLSLLLHYTFQHARIRQFVTYRQNLQIQHELAVKSDFDTLTELLARSTFFHMADSVIEENKDELLVICLLDLDGFKEINDTYGHQLGDKAIRVAAEEIYRTLGIDPGEKWSYSARAMEEKASFAGRLGGDEFICLLRGYKSVDEVSTLMEKLLVNLNAVKFDQIEGLRASFGLTVVMEEDRNVDGPYQRADDALYESKREGKNRITFNNKYKRWRES